MDIDLTGKTALVCGASQGIGAAIARELALLGASVLLLARSQDQLQAVMTSLPVSSGQQHALIVADIARTEELRQKLEQQLRQVPVIHLLINNTGGPPAGPLLDTDVADLANAFHTHLLAAHLLVQALAPGMKAAGYGRIVNILSTAVRQPINGLGISNTVRAAVANWAKTLSNELAPYGITVNNLLPGYIQTARLDYLFGKQAIGSNTTVATITAQAIAQIPAGRLGKTDEIAAAVAFLCSPAAAYINGINLPVDGGRLTGL